MQGGGINEATAKILYPVPVETAICELSNPQLNNVLIEVVDIQQQTTGDSCGLFAIAYAGLLSQDTDPTTAYYDEAAMRRELVRAFELRDITSYLSAVTKSNPDSRPKINFSWKTNVYCNCRMPDDGRQMVNCTGCRKWFHKDCIIGKDGIFQSGWQCRKCTEKTRERDEKDREKEVQIRKEEKALIELRAAVLKHPNTPHVESL